MKADAALERLASRISPSAIRDYAKATGWEQVRDGVRGRIYLLRNSVDSLRQIVIPMDFSDDYAEVILDAVSRLASLEGRPVEALLADLSTPDADILRFRVASQDVDVSLPLQDGIELLEGAKRALLAAACSVVNPVSHHPRMSRTESNQLLEQCRLGQTEQGSFIVKIACPLSAVDRGPTDVPFVRKTTELLVGSAHRIVDAIERDRVESVFEVSEALPTISSNLCEAILQMQSTKENASLTISAQWSNLLPERARVALPTSVIFNPDYFDFVEDIYLRLRPSDTDRESVFAATVETLNGDIGDDGRRFGEVTLYVFHDDGTVKARCALTPDEYAIADRAHMSGTMVALRGTLQRGRRVHRITGIQSFEPLLPSGQARQ